MTTRLETPRSIQIALALLGALLLPTAALVALAYSFTDIPGPAGSGVFGQAVTVLSNGNIVVSDPGYSAGAVSQVGAVYLYDGMTHKLISKLVGSTSGDAVGLLVTMLSNGQYVVRSPFWHKGAANNVGAVTWCSATLGCTGVVTTSNSLVGSTAGDEVGSQGVITLSSGNYVVVSPYWSRGAITGAGAVTWCSGTAGCTGPVMITNSLVGSTANDQVGYGGVTALSNGNYVVRSPFWSNGAAASAGAVTWCSGTAGRTGAVTTSNSLVGKTANDQVGFSGGTSATELSNGNYVVASSHWSNGAAAGAGAVTWCSGTLGCTGPVTTTNSLVGSTAGDGVGFTGVTALSNGNYVVDSIDWSNGAVGSAGAVTWCSGTVGCTGPVTTTNSLVGSTANDQVGYAYPGVTALSNGNYVVDSASWHNGAAAGAGAVTWCSGTAGCQGVVTTTNSLVGSTANDFVGDFGTTALSNSNYVVDSPNWSNGAAAGAGAVTWCSGTLGCTGPVTTTNSLVGSTANDQVGYGYPGSPTALSNGNYVVDSYHWSNGAATGVGAVTWCDGTAGCQGVVTTTNSLVGSAAYDLVGYGYPGITALSNGNYVVGSTHWSNGAIARAGAVTWCSGTLGCAGVVVTTSNSLVGSTANDQVGYAYPGITALSNGNYVVVSTNWSNGTATNAGAATWCRGTLGCMGVVTTTNSLVGSTAGDQVGYDGATALSNGNYVVVSEAWHNGATTGAGAVTFGTGAAGVVGPINANNSVRGTAAGGGNSMFVAVDNINHQVVVGRPADNIVSLLNMLSAFKLNLPLVARH